MAATSRLGLESAFLLLVWLAQACARVTVVPVPDNGRQAAVVRVVDGDTIQLGSGESLRYIGINSPEQGQPFYQEAKEANRRLVEDKSVLMVFDTQATDRFGRLMAYVWVDGTFVNQELLRGGYATVYTQPPNVRYSAVLLAAEHEARQTGIGLWEPSGAEIVVTGIHYNAPGADEDNPNGEWLELRNEGAQTADLTGFMLRDEATHVYVFSETRLTSHSVLRVYSGHGRDSADSLYWGLSDDAVWNNDGDTAYLWDTAGHLVDSYRYP